MNIFSRIRNRLSHAQIMALGFFMVIITGTILLMLPVSSGQVNGHRLLKHYLRL